MARFVSGYGHAQDTAASVPAHPCLTTVTTSYMFGNSNGFMLGNHNISIMLGNPNLSSRLATLIASFMLGNSNKNFLSDDAPSVRPVVPDSRITWHTSPAVCSIDCQQMQGVRLLSISETAVSPCDPSIPDDPLDLDSRQFSFVFVLCTVT